MQQKDKIAEGSRLPSLFLEAPFLIIEGRLGDFKKGLIPKTNKQTDFYRKIIFVRKGISSLLQPKKLEKI